MSKRFIKIYYLKIVMARIEVEYKGVRGVMTDGYFPPFSYFKAINWEAANKEKLPLPERAKRDFSQNTYPRYLAPKEDPKAGPRSNFYRKMEEILEWRLCQYKKSPCAQVQFPAVGVHRMGLIVKRAEKINREEIANAFTKEIEHDLSAGKETYVFHLAYLDLNPDNYCPVFEECAKNWMDFMGFEIKKEYEYVDFEGFKRSAEILLREDAKWEAEHHGWFGKISDPRILKLMSSG